MDTVTLLTLADAYGAHLGLKRSTVATYAAKDGKFFKGLAGGASCTLAKAGRIVDWFDYNWPADLAWPRDISRPRSSKTKVAA